MTNNWGGARPRSGRKAVDIDKIAMGIISASVAAGKNPVTVIKDVSAKVNRFVKIIKQKK